MVDYRISRSLMVGLGDDELIWKLIEPIWPDSKVKDELKHIENGTLGQRALYSIILFIREVDNGGIEQFLLNSSGMYIEEVLKGMDLTGCSQQLLILKDAITIFPNSVVPINRTKRSKTLIKELNKIKKDPETYFEEYNEQLYGEEKLYPILLKYVETHPNEFYNDLK